MIYRKDAKDAKVNEGFVGDTLCAYCAFVLKNRVLRIFRGCRNYLWARPAAYLALTACARLAG